MKRFIVSLALLILVLSLMTGCKEPTPRPLEGIWTIDSTEGTPGSLELGDGQIELSFFMEFVFEMYQGDGTVGTQDYTATAMYTPDFLGTDVGINLYQDGVDDSEIDYIELDGTLGSSSISGTYTGWGAYASGPKDIGSGTFTATRN